ncbi:prefoldin subunit beta [Candidatus Pacearchaeota archaeon]|nr:prefoldin subunit beta [Candidatus Pacearchaeota archaeon]
MDNQKIQEMQILEQNIQNLLLQKQAFDMELSETKSALKEIENAKDDIFKIIGQLMIKTTQSKIKQELLNKEKILSLRIKTIEKQEIHLTEQLEKLREEIMKQSKK